MGYDYDETYIDINNIKVDEVGKYRYSLYIPFKSCLTDFEDKIVLVIMKNPSIADSKKSDKTINNVISFCKGKYNGVHIVNVFPFRSSKPENLKDFINSTDFEKHMNKNFVIIEETITKVDEIIVAWGAYHQGEKYEDAYINEISKITEIVKIHNKKMYAMKFNSSLSPWHPRNWEKSFELDLYEWK